MSAPETVTGLRPPLHAFQNRWVWPCVCAAALLVLHLILLQFYTAFSSAFSHDSAYIAIVARNLLNGKGLVNDASWLVFLNPACLPMPFHNANPLYPLLTALTAKAFGLSVARAGLLVSALASIGLFLAAFYLVSYWLQSIWSPLLIALAVTFFPAVWQDSLRMLPDSSLLTFLILGLAFFVRADKIPLCIAAGISFGAAWLCRSTASLIGPALAVYAFASWAWPKALLRLALAGVAALAVAAPWLVYTARVWGSPFRSDASYYVFQDFYAKDHGGSIDRYWRSPDPPPPPAQLLRSEGIAIFTHTITGIPKVIRAWLRDGWNQQYLPRIALLLLFVSLAVAGRRYLLTAPVLASLVYGAIQVGVLSLRSDSLEPRYLAPLTALTVLWLGYGVAWIFATRRPRRPAAYALIAGCLLLAGYIPLQDAILIHYTAAEDNAVVSRRRVRLSISAAITHLDPVIVYDPYFYTFDTGAQSLSIPDSSDAYLLRYMERYHSRWIILTADEVRFWKPDWLMRLPPWLRVRGIFDGNTLFERVPSS
jgi:4-amino-4-deoxy-L-arabinose transferase-like glycosyltransferase